MRRRGGRRITCPGYGKDIPNEKKTWSAAICGSALRKIRRSQAMTTSSVTERELKFDVRPEFVLPDLSDALADVERTDRESQQIVSEYFDTADYALLRFDDAAAAYGHQRRGLAAEGAGAAVPRGDSRPAERRAGP